MAHRPSQKLKATKVAQQSDAWYALFFPLIGAVIVGIQAVLLPLRSGSPGFVIFLLFAIFFGIIRAVIVGELEDRNVKKPGISRLITGLYFATCFSPLTYVIHSSRANFHAFATSYKIPQPADVWPSNKRPLFVLLSDLHVTDRPQTLESKPGNGKPAEQMLSILTQSQVRPKLCIVSGDLTDRGAASEWRLLDSILKRNFGEAANSATRLLMVPGNHDLQGAPTDAFRETDYGVYGDLTGQISFGQRQEEFYKVAAEWEGTLASASGTTLRDASFSSIWKDVVQDAQRAEVKAYPNPYPNRRAGNQDRTEWVKVYPPGFREKLDKAEALFNALFPLKYFDLDAGLMVLMLNSSARWSPGDSMGLGDLGREQLQTLQRELKNLESLKFKYLVVLLHHAPVRRESDRWTLWQAFAKHPGDTDVWAHTFLALNVEDAKVLLESLRHFADARPDVQVLVFHGHRHGTFLGRTDKGLTVVEAPAVVESAPGFWVGDETSTGLRVSWVPLSLLSQHAVGPSSSRSDELGR